MEVIGAFVIFFLCMIYLKCRDIHDTLRGQG